MRFLQIILALVVLLSAKPVCAREKAIQRESLASYLQRMQVSAIETQPASAGSLWNDSGRLASMASDYKASRVGDVITILVAQNVTADNAGNVASDRSLKANSGIDALGGGFTYSELQNLFTPHSSQTLQGKAQASSSSSLKTSLAGWVAAVLPNGTLVVEAERQVTMNNERQTILLRGLVRPGDINAGNLVSSNVIGNLELELKGKGVISDGTRPPNAVMRVLLKLVGF